MSDPRAPFAGQHDALTKRILVVFLEVYNELGYGFLESVYCRAMHIALQQNGLTVAAEVQVPVWFRGQSIGAFRADLIVEQKVILELKTTDQIIRAHESQLFHYLRSSPIEVGLVLNFGPAPGSRRIDLPNTQKRGIRAS
jgi:GxxExxY protein